jgi:DNA recombination protein RmuC
LYCGDKDAILSAPDAEDIETALIAYLLIVLTLGLAIGVALGSLASRQTRLRLERDVERLRFDKERELERLRHEQEKDRAVHDERLKAYQDAEEKFRDAFSTLSSEALKSNTEQFLSLAQTKLQQVRTETNADIESRRKSIEDLLAPMARTLDHVDREIAESEKRRMASGATLIEKIAALDSMGQDLRGETQRLVNALRRPGVRGRWGELQLKRVVELAGMIEHCDFEEQQTLTVDERRYRPDVIVRLPGGKYVVVDAKAPLDAYLRALEAPDEPARQLLLQDHARQVRTHLMQLAAKGYAANVQPSPDFVVMFLPGEMFLSAALEQDPSLIEFGAAGAGKRVIPASPTTLIALLRAVAYGWQQEAVARDAQQIAEYGRKLYEGIGKLAEHFDRLGTRLRSSLEAYNETVGSLEGNVLVKARKFKELRGADAGADIRQIEPIDRVPRMLQAPELTDGLPFQDDAEEETGAGDTEVASKVRRR